MWLYKQDLPNTLESEGFDLYVYFDGEGLTIAKQAEDNRDTDKSAADQEARYTSCMTQIQAIRSEYDALHSNNEKIVVDLKAKLEEKLLEASTKSDEFIAFRRETASGAENSRTGKTFTHSAIDQLEATEAKKVSEVIAVRLENIKLRNKLKRHEQLLRQKVCRFTMKAFCTCFTQLCSSSNRKSLQTVYISSTLNNSRLRTRPLTRRSRSAMRYYFQLLSSE